MAHLTAKRATCPRLSVGCVLVHNNVPVAFGYNGTLSKEPHCPTTKEHRQEDHCTIAVHAEQNAVNHLQRTYGQLTAYVTHTPCPKCKLVLKYFGVTRFVIGTEYPQDVTTLW